MDIINKNRRRFLKNALIGAAGFSSYALLSSCSTFDDYLFEDRFNFKDEVMIIGGGISGLYLAHKLRSSKTEFRLFEGSNTFGGRIKSNAGSDYGASLLSVNDMHAKDLVKELSLQTKTLNKEFLYLTEGMQALPDSLVERIIGLIPYRNFRLRWKLVEISKFNSGFGLVFDSPSGQKRVKCRKLALAIPPTQWPHIQGLLKLPEMKWAPDWLETLKVENTTKIILPGSAAANLSRPLIEVDHEDLSIRQVVKKNRVVPSLEIDVNYTAAQDISVDYIYSVLKRKLQLNYPFEKLSMEQYYNWQQIKLIRGAKFKNLAAIPESSNNHFQIVGDFASNNAIYTIEGALQSAIQAFELLL